MKKFLFVVVVLMLLVVNSYATLGDALEAMEHTNVKYYGKIAPELLRGGMVATVSLIDGQLKTSTFYLGEIGENMISIEGVGTGVISSIYTSTGPKGNYWVSFYVEHLVVMISDDYVKNDNFLRNYGNYFVQIINSNNNNIVTFVIR